MSPVDDDEVGFEYGKWMSFDIEAALKQQKEELYALGYDPFEIWPSWLAGVPTKLRRCVRHDGFLKGGVFHRRAYRYVFRVYDWCAPHTIESLGRNSGLLPRPVGDQRCGVYRIFSEGAAINRICAIDPTGTLYIGLGGVGKNSWSNLRSRLTAIVKGDHHAIGRKNAEMFRNKFSRDSLCLEWAFMGPSENADGSKTKSAYLAESLLLACYQDTFGEYPPWNEKG